MCELFALSSLAPTTVTLSLAEFARHGGATADNTDGWGIAFYDGPDLNLIRDPRPAHDSPWVAFTAAQRLRGDLVLSHIRKATQGRVRLANTQPYRRELGGRMHAFIHNGDLDVAALALPPGAAHHPVGDTDSERAFCLLLARLAPLWRAKTDGGGAPSLAARRDVFAAFAADMRAAGVANMIYADGDALFVHAHKRKQADGTVRPPGLHMLERRCDVGADGEEVVHPHAQGLDLSGGGQLVTLFASVPLTGEPWRPLDEGTVLVARDGALTGRAIRPA